MVDVASTDGTGDWLAAAWPAVRVRRLTKNDGPSPGRNAGIVEAAAPYVLLMDADVVVRPDAVQRLRAAMAADPKAKVGSPIVVHASRPDTIQYAATVDDPGTYTRPFTLQLPWRRENSYGMFEYACHEGNHSLFNILSGARADDREAAATSTRP